MNNQTQQQISEKLKKSKYWIIGNIYLYIIGINLVLFVTYSIISRIIGFKESALTSTFLLLVSAVATFFAIKWGVGSVLKKSVIDSHEFLKISLLVGIIPIIFSVITSGWIYYINLERFSDVAWYLIPRFLSEFITTFISGFFYGITTYFWFKKLSKRF